MPDASEPHATPSLSDAVGRAEALIDRLSHGLRDAATSVRNSASTDPADAAEDASEARPPVDRAADIVDTLGKHASAWYDSASHAIRRGAALAREEAEDILADAQALRNGPP